MLAFCVSAVLFGIQGMPLMDMVARSFVVFVAVVAGLTMILMVAGTMRRASRVPQNQSGVRDTGEDSRQEPGGASTQPASHTP